jgi:hypothetical protein
LLGGDGKIMTRIPYDEETTGNWNWFAADDEGNIGHLATGGFRSLPESVRCDWQRAAELIEYFESAPAIGDYGVRPEVLESELSWEMDMWHFKRDKNHREEYLGVFGGMARRGPFSYDTMDKILCDYIGVTIPTVPPKITMLPQNLQHMLARTKGTFRFRESPRIAESVTLDW